MHQLKDESMPKLLQQSNLSDKVVSACLRQPGLLHYLRKKTIINPSSFEGQSSEITHLFPSII